MIDSIKKSSLEFFNTNGLPSKKLENWKFTSSKNFKNFNKSLSSDEVKKIESDELSIVFINGVLDKDSLENFKFADLIEVKNLNELTKKELLYCSESFLNESMFNLGVSEFENGSYISFKENSVIEEVINIKNYFFENGQNERVSSFNIFHINERSEISIIEEDIKENFSIFNLKLNKFICENSSIFKHGKSYNDDSQTHSLSYNYYQIEQDVALNVDSMVKSSFFNKEFIEVDLNKVGSDAKINILNLG
ncbi:MAG: hypothetical protein VW523_02105, partial [Candidatus Neomarinimicrobiota bacterium]